MSCYTTRPCDVVCDIMQCTSWRVGVRVRVRVTMASLERTAIRIRVTPPERAVIRVRVTPPDQVAIRVRVTPSDQAAIRVRVTPVLSSEFPSVRACSSRSWSSNVRACDDEGTLLSMRTSLAFNLGCDPGSGCMAPNPPSSHAAFMASTFWVRGVPKSMVTWGCELSHGSDRGGSRLGALDGGLVEDISTMIPVLPMLQQFQWAMLWSIAATVSDDFALVFVETLNR